MYGLGWIPDAPDSRDHSFDLMRLAADDVPTSVSLMHYIPGVYSQGATSSCVAQAVALAISILERKHNDFVETLTYPAPPSRLYLYYNSRRLHLAHRRDEGTHLRTCLEGARRFGVPDEDVWRFEVPRSINRQPNWEAYSQAFGRRGLKYKRILSSNEQRVADIRTALANGYPVVFGLSVDSSIQADNGPHVIEAIDSSDLIGGHAMTIVGYSEKPGQTVFQVANSWGTAWRDDGFVWMSDDVIKWDKSRDFSVVHGWKALDVK